MMNPANTKRGMLLGIIAYSIWSVFPFYFKRLEAYDSMEIIVHRALWTFLFLWVFLLFKKQWGFIQILRQNPQWIAFTFCSGVLIATNWTTYVWAVNHDQILEASLGYFLSPLLGVALSFFVLKERLRTLQYIAVLLASLAIVLQFILTKTLSLVAILLAFTFSFYGIINKKSPLDAVSSLFLETLMVLPFFLYWIITHDVASKHISVWTSLDMFWIVLSGPITLIPLLCFTQAAKLLNFSTLSFMQYISPTAVFFIGVLYYHEPFNIQKMIVFALIWSGLFLYTYDLLKNHQKKA